MRSELHEALKQTEQKMSAADAWRKLGEDFQLLAKEQHKLVRETRSGNLILRATCTYDSDLSPEERELVRQGLLCLLYRLESGTWQLGQGRSEDFKARFEALATHGQSGNWDTIKFRFLFLNSLSFIGERGGSEDERGRGEKGGEESGRTGGKESLDLGKEQNVGMECKLSQGKNKMASEFDEKEAGGQANSSIPEGVEHPADGKQSAATPGTTAGEKQPAVNPAGAAEQKQPAANADGSAAQPEAQNNLGGGVFDPNCWKTSVDTGLDPMRKIPPATSLKIEVRKPPADHYVHAHPNPEFNGVFPLYSDSLSKRFDPYLIAPELVELLPPQVKVNVKSVRLVPTVTETGRLFLWHVAQTGSEWHDSGDNSILTVMTLWRKVIPDGNGYRLDPPEVELAPPVFPDWPFSEYLARAFKDRYIDSLDHHVIKRLRGVK